ncbi:MAG: porphobilinogen synthase, partial [Gemmatimonadales bacterium]
MVREATIAPEHLIAPLFVTAASTARRAIDSMPGIFQWPVENVASEAERLAELGVKSLILFGIPKHKDDRGTDSYDENGVVQCALREIKRAVPELVIVTDVCLCEYTDHGHCGIVNGTAGMHNPHLPDGYLLNDESVELLARIAQSHVDAGADVVAPSAMLDGMVAAIRDELDQCGALHVPIMSYSVKYASSYYGPFREAAQGTPKFGDRSTHQMDPANAREAIREHAQDIAEGADF